MNSLIFCYQAPHSNFTLWMKTWLTKQLASCMKRSTRAVGNSLLWKQWFWSLISEIGYYTKGGLSPVRQLTASLARSHLVPRTAVEQRLRTTMNEATWRRNYLAYWVCRHRFEDMCNLRLNFDWLDLRFWIFTDRTCVSVRVLKLLFKRWHCEWNELDQLTLSIHGGSSLSLLGWHQTSGWSS